MTNVTGKSTAPTRKNVPEPIRWLRDHGLELGGKRVLDFGCGRASGYKSEWDNYDPYWHPEYPTGKYDIIFCCYVLNVVTTDEANNIMDEMYRLLATSGKIYIAVRRDLPREGKPGRGCYQRFVTLPLEIRHSNSYRTIYITNGKI